MLWIIKIKINQTFLKNMQQIFLYTKMKNQYKSNNLNTTRFLKLN